MCAQVPNPESQESAGTRPCRGLGCPQILLSAPNNGNGAEGIRESGCRWARPTLRLLLDSRLRGNDTEKVSPQGEFETRLYTSPQRACIGAEPLCRGSGGCPPILQFEKVQDVSCGGLGCPQIPLFSPQDRRSASGGVGARGLKEGCETAFWGGYWRSFDTSPRLWP